MKKDKNTKLDLTVFSKRKNPQTVRISEPNLDFSHEKFAKEKPNEIFLNRSALTPPRKE